MIKETLTDPRDHDKNNFMYLAHGMLSRDFYSASEKIDNIRESGKFFSASLIGKLDEANAKERLYCGTKLAHTDTYGTFGLIFEPAKEDDIYVAWNCDLGSPLTQDELKEFALKHKGKKKHPICLLSRTIGIGSVRYNELIVEGNEESEIKGVFYNDFEGAVDKAGMLRDFVRSKTGEEVPMIQLERSQSKSYECMLSEERRAAGECEMLQLELSQMEFHNPSRALSSISYFEDSMHPEVSESQILEFAKFLQGLNALRGSEDVDVESFMDT